MTWTKMFEDKKIAHLSTENGKQISLIFSFCAHSCPTPERWGMLVRVEFSASSTDNEDTERWIGHSEYPILTSRQNSEIGSELFSQFDSWVREVSAQTGRPLPSPPDPLLHNQTTKTKYKTPIVQGFNMT